MPAGFVFSLRPQTASAVFAVIDKSNTGKPDNGEKTIFTILFGEINNFIFKEKNQTAIEMVW